MIMMFSVPSFAKKEYALGRVVDLSKYANDSSGKRMQW
jgi:hypothetical protein